jgi:hypothetical protein
MHKNDYKNLIISFCNIFGKQFTGTPMLEHHQKDQTARNIQQALQKGS